MEVLGERVPRFTRTDSLLERPTVYDPNYYWYAGRFFRLWETLGETNPGVTVKMLDHALWRGLTAPSQFGAPGTKRIAELAGIRARSPGSTLSSYFLS